MEVNGYRQLSGYLKRPVQTCKTSVHLRNTNEDFFLKPEPVLYSSLTATQLSDSIYMDYLISLMNVLKHQSGTVDAHL